MRLSAPLKAKIRRRLVFGLHEVMRGVKAKKLKLLVVAPNIDAGGGEGGLDEKVRDIVSEARGAGIPLVFGLSKRRLGKALGKSIKVSTVGVYNFDGAEDLWKQVRAHMGRA
ncbi:unnamed protein product, partial [Discosporangium mesarthrocarpum]